MEKFERKLGFFSARSPGFCVFSFCWNYCESRKKGGGHFLGTKLGFALINCDLETNRCKSDAIE